VLSEVAVVESGVNELGAFLSFGQRQTCYHEDGIDLDTEAIGAGAVDCLFRVVL
jgi:hypothetical protein